MRPDNQSPEQPTDDGVLLALLREWLPQQRWFAGKDGDRSGIQLLSRESVGDTDDGASAELALVTAETAAGPAIYQVLLGWRTDVPERLGHAIIGTAGDGICYDALHDHSISSMLLTALAEGSRLGALTAVSEPDAQIDPDAPGLVLSAEQSNTSVVYGDSVILKVFRRLDPGPNPDAEIHRALHAAGSSHIADPVGELLGEVRGTPTTLALATRFFANSADGWAMATASVRDLMAEGDLHADEVGGDFAAESERLGEAVAEVHRDLARAMGTDTMDASQLRDLLTEMTAQAEQLATTIEELAEHLDGIRAVYRQLTPGTGDGDDGVGGVGGDGVGEVRPILVQRIHGDLHLGQVLRTLHGWAVIDFEGEPSRPLAVRRAMHSPLQDVAGMLRSFDYAAHQLSIPGASDAQHAYRAAEWAARNRAAFCDGYARAAGADPRDSGPLLRALELAKAVYEVGYEHGHRPSWAPIPLAAVAELVKEAR